jgi:glycosyltransferase involved in cell wall biosynthesis
MKISIITVVKNGMPFLTTAIKSFELQKYKKKELIIVYSSSADSTEKFLIQLKNRHKIIKKNTKSIYKALNEGINNSTGDIVGILHSDDVFFDQNVLKKISLKIKNANCDGIYGGIFFSKKHNLTNIIRVWKPRNLTQNLIRLGFMPPHTSIFLKRKIFKKIGNYSTLYKISSDYEFILRLFLKNSINLICSNIIHTIMRSGGASTNLKNFFLKLNEDYKIIKKFNLNNIIILIKIILKIPQFFVRKKINNKFLNEINLQ